MGLVCSTKALVCAAAMAAVMVGIAYADDDDSTRRHDDAERATHGTQSGEFKPLAEILQEVRARYPGQVVETELETSDGKSYYEFHILGDDGRVIEIKANSRTGHIVDPDGDDD